MENYIKEARPLQLVRKIVIKGAVDLIFRRSSTPALVVAGETDDAMKSVRTFYEGDKLVIEREGKTVNFVSGRQGFIGGVSSIIIGNLVGRRSSDVSIDSGRVVVAIALPEAPALKIKGSGDAKLVDVQQASLSLEVQGSGSIHVSGQVDTLDVEVSGSGEVDAENLCADRASLLVSGSGEIEAHVRTQVRTRVSGSGEIKVHGNPAQRDTNIAGSGRIRFR